jgi:hypothetical protein
MTGPMRVVPWGALSGARRCSLQVPGDPRVALGFLGQAMAGAGLQVQADLGGMSVRGRTRMFTLSRMAKMVGWGTLLLPAVVSAAARDQQGTRWDVVVSGDDARADRDLIARVLSDAVGALEATGVVVDVGPWRVTRPDAARR